MGAAWKFVGVFRRGRREPLHLECVVAIPDFENAKLVAKSRLIGADETTAIELSRPELRALKIQDGEHALL